MSNASLRLRLLSAAEWMRKSTEPVSDPELLEDAAACIDELEIESGKLNGQADRDKQTIVGLGLHIVELESTLAEAVADAKNWKHKARKLETPMITEDEI